MTREPFEYNDICYNDVIHYLETKWNRKLDPHERHILIEGYRFGRLREMESYYSIETIDWQLKMQQKG